MSSAQVDAAQPGPAVDIIDVLAGLEPDSPIAALRNGRTQARDNAQRSFEVLLEPADPGGFPVSGRYAVAYFTARLHDLESAAGFYADLLGDEAPELVDVITAAADDARGSGPYGRYREPGLAGESVTGPDWRPPADTAAALGDRLTAALAHTQLLVLRPRESSPAALRALVDAGWTADDIVRLAQLVAFLTFQFRVASGLRALRLASPTTAGAVR